VTIHTPCQACDGKGSVRKKKTIKVTIPAGIEEGQRLRVRGEGEVGSRQSPPGDLFVQVSIKKHAVFERDGTDIVCEARVPFTVAVLGGEISVPTLKGSAKLTIPVATQSATLFEMKGKGIPSTQGFGTGSQFVRVHVEVPKKVSKKAKDLLESLAQELSGPKSKKTIFEKVKDAFD
jgi:molecular chaperone DnaJ